METAPKKCPRCGGPVVIEAHPSTAGTQVYRCQGKGAFPCKQWGAIVPEGLAPTEEIQAEIAKGSPSSAVPGVARKAKARPKKKATKKKGAR